MKGASDKRWKLEFHNYSTSIVDWES